MKTYILPFILTLVWIGSLHAQNWTENFQSGYIGSETVGLDNNLPSGPDWSIQGTPTPGYFEVTNVGGGDFEISLNETGSEIEWISESISINSSNRYIVSASASSIFANSNDYLKFFYSIDGGPELQFGEFRGSTISFNNEYAAYAVTGSSLQIIIKGFVENDGFLADYIYFDDIAVTQMTELYSISSANWNANGTWSSTRGGASCSCTPTTSDYVYITGSTTVNINAASTAGGITVENGATLRWLSPTINLSIPYIEIEDGGTTTRNGNPNANLNLSVGSRYVVKVEDMTNGLDIHDLVVGNSAFTEITGSGRINIEDDLALEGDNISMENNFVGDFIVADELQFNGDDIVFTNNNTITINSYLFFNQDNCQLINNGTMSSNNEGVLVNQNNDDNNSIVNNGTINLSAGSNVGESIDLSNADFVFDNYGVVNMEGEFINAAGTEFINNYDGAVWNFAGTNGSTDIELYAGFGSNYFIYSGSGNQMVITPQDSYSILGIEGGGEKSLDASITVSIQLQLGLGLVSIGNHNLTLENGASIIGENNNSYVQTEGSGELVQNGIGAGGRTGNIVFPVGVNSEYTPISIDNSSGTLDNFRVSVLDGTSVLDPYNPVGGTSSSYDVNRTWLISEEIAGGSSAQITFQWNTSNEGVDFVTNTGLRSDVSVSHYNGVIWETVGNNLMASGYDPYSVTVSGINDFSPFVVAGPASPLPIELISFNAFSNGKTVEVNWETSMEQNNEYFSVERSVDGIEFTAIAIINGAIHSDEPISYQYEDINPVNGISYYRLRQTDLDGTSTVSEIRSVNHHYDGVSDNLNLKLYPNPVKGGIIKAELEGFIPNDQVAVQIINAKGKVVYSDMLQVAAAGNFKVNIALPTHLSSGLYKLNFRAANEGMSITKSFVIY